MGFNIKIGNTGSGLAIDTKNSTGIGAPVVAPNITSITAGGHLVAQYNASEIFFSTLTARKRVADKYEIIGVTEIVFTESSQDASGGNARYNALTDTIDTATYPDKAIIKLKNERGYNVYLTTMQLYGNPIMRSSGSMGSIVLDLMKRDDDIRRNGEKLKTISNDYIFDKAQVEKISDYWYKRCGEKKHLYALQMKGTALHYEPGEWYTFALGEAGTNEYISATVEVLSVSCQRSAGGIGSTNLLVRECMESWSKTTLYAARLVTGASPKRRSNQSNNLIVASSSFDGTYDYRCDGTADDSGVGWYN
jgi:hypothetical protein